MRSRAAVGALLGALLVLLAGCGGGPAGGEPADLADRLDTRMVELMDRYDVPGAAVAVLRRGEPTLVRTYGAARLPDAPMTRGSVDHVGSISKPVTAWGVMTLVVAGRLGLDDRVAPLLHTWEFPGEDPRTSQITVRQLLTHTSGLALGTVGVHYEPGGEVPSLRENLSAEAVLVRDPGSGFGYSNVGFNLLELLVEDVTGEPFADYLGREVLAPLGMGSATYSWDPSLEHLVPHGYDLDGVEVPAYVYPEKGSGGLFATVDDVAAFVAATMPGSGGEVLPAATVLEMSEPAARVTGIYRVVTPSYGLGWFVETLPGGERAIWHGGQGHGWMTHLHAVPETGDGIVILTNSQRSWPLFAEVLGDWGRWTGLGPVGMSRVSTISDGVTGGLVLIGALALGTLASVAVGVVRGRRRPGVGSWWRLGLGVLLGVGGAALWLGDPLYLRAVFPLLWPWLGVVLVGAAAAVVSSAAAPPVTPRRRPPPTPARSGRPGRPPAPGRAGRAW